MQQANERSGSVARTVVVVVVALGVVLGAGYFGLMELQKEIRLQQSQTRGVIIELKTAALDEVRSGGAKTVDEIKKLGGAIATAPKGAGAPPAGAAVAAPLAAMKATIDEVQAGQKAILQRLDGLREKRPMAAAAPEPAPGTHPNRLNRTVHFPLGAFQGAEVDAQLAAILPEMKAYANGRLCMVNVLGFSDTLGNDAANLTLSQERADHVAARLEAQGVEVTNVKGWGERWLEVHTLDGVKNDSNRRVVIEMDCAAIPEPKPEAKPAPAPAGDKSTS